MENDYMIFNFDDESKNIPKINKTIIVDALHLKKASTTFLHKLIEAKDRIIVINLQGQPRQIFDICGLNDIIKTSKDEEQIDDFF